MDASPSPHFVSCSKDDWPPPAHICPPFIILFAYYFFPFFLFSGFPSGSYERDWFVSSGEDILCYKHTEWAVFGK